MGCGERPHDGCRSRPHTHTLGKIPSLSAVGGCSVQHLRNPAVHNSRLGLRGKTCVGLCDLHSDDDSLHRHQRALRGHARRHDRGLPGKDRILVVPHVLRLRRFVHCPFRVGSVVLAVCRHRYVASVELAGSHGRDSPMLFRAVPALFQDDTRAAEHRQRGIVGQRPQGTRDKQAVVAAQRRLFVLQPVQHRARRHCGFLLCRRHRRRAAHRGVRAFHAVLLGSVPRGRGSGKYGGRGAGCAHNQAARQETHVHHGGRASHPVQYSVLHLFARQQCRSAAHAPAADGDFGAHGCDVSACVVDVCRRQ